MAKFKASSKVDFKKLDIFAAFDGQSTYSNLTSSSFTIESNSGATRGYVAIIQGRGFTYSAGQPPTGIIDTIKLYDRDGSTIFTITDFNLTPSQAIAYANKSGFTVNSQIFNSKDIVLGSTDNDLLDGFGGDDKLQGGNGDDLLEGGSGKDLLQGGLDDDRLMGGTGQDKLDGGTGKDMMDGGTDNDLMMGGAGNDMLMGGTGNDRLKGGIGADTLIGGPGGDFLEGGTGNDSFVLHNKTFFNNLVRLADFVAKSDTLVLDNYLYKKLSNTNLSTQFRDITDGMSEQDSNDYLLYNHDTGNLFYDRDGDGGSAPVKIAYLAENANGNHPMLTHGDILII